MGQFLWFPDELVLFAQQVLNATEGEQLDLNGALEFRTWYALDRFRRKYGLGSRGTIDYKTQLVLVQRALEELFDEPIPGKYGDLDEETKQAIISFKLRNGMGKDLTLDAATRAALMTALGRRLVTITQVAAASQIARYR